MSLRKECNVTFRHHNMDETLLKMAALVFTMLALKEKKKTWAASGIDTEAVDLILLWG